MAKINVLSFEIANLIAAGEVVERPSSVLKELIENSIDSGAKHIVAEIKKGGVALIRVSDDGCGMEKEDLPIALKRHATSKISEKEDLGKIMTLGFRGEALAAISSVSMMTIITKTKTAEIGSMLTAEAGTVTDVSDVGAADGTTVVVENLFYNVPARRKFLKKDSTEAMNVTALVEKVALSRPDISIQLLVDGEEKFKTHGNSNLKDTVYAVFGKEFSSKLIEADGIANGIRVHGFIGRSDNVRKNRNLQNFFINGRYVKSLTAMAAIEKAYTSYIAPECFPTCVLFLEMSPEAVDVNVHPAKLEVKFSDERPVFETVYYTVKRAIEEYEYRPELTLTKKEPKYNPANAYVPIGADTKGEQIKISTVEHTEKITVQSPIRRDFTTSREYAASPKQRSFSGMLSVGSGMGHRESNPSEKQSDRISSSESIAFLEKYRTAAPVQRHVETKPVATTPITSALTPNEPEIEIPEHKIIGEAFDCYVMVQMDNTLLVIDKHAAHERIIFEDLKKSRARDGRIASQSLMLPITVILQSDEIASAAEFESELCSVGFEFNLNERSVDIMAIPDAISAQDAEGLFVSMLGELSAGLGSPENTEAIRREKALYQIACKAAIKGGRIYDRSIIEWLVKRVLTIPDITVCPHGRPVAYRLTKHELDRQFDRIK